MWINNEGQGEYVVEDPSMFLPKGHRAYRASFFGTGLFLFSGRELAMAIATRARVTNRQPLLRVAAEAGAAFPGQNLTESQFQDSSEKLCSALTSVAFRRNEGWRDIPLGSKRRTSATGSMS